MVDMTVFRDRLARGWGLSLFSEQSLKNLNQFHVTYVLAEILLLCYVFPGSFYLLLFALLFHLLNLGLNLSDAANAIEYARLLPVVLRYATALYDGKEGRELNAILREC